MGALIFVPALAACVIFGFVFAIFAANHYLTVLQSTGSGAKQVAWVSEPMVDNFWKVFYLGWLIGLWLGPAYFLGRAFASGTDLPWMRYAVPLSVFWICFPVSQLSSLSGPSIWLPLHHDVFGRLARKPPVVVGFLVLSGLTLVAFGLGFHWTFNAPGILWLFIGTPLFVTAALVYARLLGRLAFALMFTRSILSRKKKKKPPTDFSSEAEKSRTSFPGEPPPIDEEEAESRFEQPSEMAPIRAPGDEDGVTGYDVRFENDRPLPRKRVRAVVAESSSENPMPAAEPADAPARPVSDDDDDATSYGVHEPEVKAEKRAPVEVVKPSEVEMRLLNRDDAPKPPKQVWNAEVFAFLLQPETLLAIALLSTIGMRLGGLVRLAREFNPVAEGG